MRSILHEEDNAMFKVIIIGLIVTVVGLFAFAAVDNVTSGMGDTSTKVNGYSTKQKDDNSVKVSISGEINHPGDYYVLTTDTLGNLIIQAGGVTQKADTKAYNTGLVINTHTSFYIPPVSETPTTCVETVIDKVNINKATESELVNIGFNANQAKALIKYREENGNFEAIDDITQVSGIGLSTFNKVKNKITIS